MSNSCAGFDTFALGFVLQSGLYLNEGNRVRLCGRKMSLATAMTDSDADSIK